MSPKSKNVVLWIVQILLAAAFAMAGGSKLTQSPDVLAQSAPWTVDVAPALVRFIGLSELLGAIGLIAPPAFRIRPQLTVLAACGLSLVMIFASVFHVARGEFLALPFTLGLFALAAFTAYGRWKLAPFQS